MRFLVQTEAALARAESKVGAIPADVGDAITEVVGSVKLEYVKCGATDGFNFRC